MEKINLQQTTIADKVTMLVKTIEFNTNIIDDDCIKGVKLYYNTANEPMYGMYWEQNLIPGTRFYKERYLTDSEYHEVLQWLLTN